MIYCTINAWEKETDRRTDRKIGKKTVSLLLSPPLPLSVRWTIRHWTISEKEGDMKRGADREGDGQR